MSTPPLHDLTINHLTAFPSNTLMYVGDTSSTPISNFVFTNNLMRTGPYPIWSTGGGSANCAAYDVPIRTINACFNPVTFADNAFITNSSLPEWPANNFVNSSESTIQFTNFNGGVGGDYSLLSTSPYASAGNDGKPLGADIAAIANATKGVY